MIGQPTLSHNVQATLVASIDANTKGLEAYKATTNLVLEQMLTHQRRLEAQVENLTAQVKGVVGVDTRLAGLSDLLQSATTSHQRMESQLASMMHILNLHEALFMYGSSERYRIADLDQWERRCHQARNHRDTIFENSNSGSFSPVVDDKIPPMKWHESDPRDSYSPSRASYGFM